MSIRGLAFKYAKAWAEHDLDAIMALHTDDTVFHLHADNSEAATSSAAVRDAFRAELARSPDLRFESKRVSFGEAHFVSEYVMSGTVNGKQFACDGVDVFVVREGLIARKDSYGDWIAYARQVDVPVATLQGGTEQSAQECDGDLS